ncbi:hypothetical protein EC844_103193 [Acinetobacter calcoaceticus]|uniref:Uncharacterized protein n=1 Tax=Acinetobacter calcoaceticus TaxID=471 RepID=A0A4R1XYM6_ACICA|nr:hypothetical protein EC844_103193 [Acinetobacter calcoaceticus]
MADKKDQIQKINQNGRPTLVISKEEIEKAANAGGLTSDWLGYLTTGTMIINKNTFSWGLLHSNTAPAFSAARFKEIFKFKMYAYNPSTASVFQGNRHTRVTKVSKVTGQIDKVAGKIGVLSDGAELVLAVKNKDAPALANKSSTMVLSRAGETAGVAIAGVCTKFAAKQLAPKRMAIAGAACFAAFNYGGSEAGEWAGGKVGETKGAINAANSFLVAIDNMDKLDQAAEEKRKQAEIKKDPMSQWQISSSD